MTIRPRPRTLAIVFAMEAEWTPWRDRHAFVPAPALAASVGGPPGRSHDATSPADSPCGEPPAQAAAGAPAPSASALAHRRGRLGTIDLRVITCGIGPARAAACASLALDPPVDALLICGFAGGLRPTLRTTEIVSPRQVQDGTAGSAPIRCDDRLIALAAASGATIVDRLLTVDRPITTAAEKQQLGRDHDIVDMEAFPLIAAAAAHGVPAAVLRVVSDAADEDLPPEVLRAMNADGSIEPRRFLTAAAVQPWRWRALARLLGLQHRARLGLADTLDRFVARFESEPPAPQG